MGWWGIEVKNTRKCFRVWLGSESRRERNRRVGDDEARKCREEFCGHGLLGKQFYLLVKKAEFSSQLLQSHKVFGCLFSQIVFKSGVGFG